MYSHQDQIQRQSFSQKIQQQFPQGLKQECTCTLCFTKYNLSERYPINLCEDQHHCCLQCLKNIIKYKKQCPFCKRQMQRRLIHKNRMIANILLDAANKKKLKIKIIENPEQQVRRLIPQSTSNFSQQIRAPLNPNNRSGQIINHDLGNHPQNRMIYNKWKFCSRLFQKIEDKLEQKYEDMYNAIMKLSFISLLLFQIPTSFQLYYALSAPESFCYDKTCQNMNDTLRNGMKSSSEYMTILLPVAIILFLFSKCFKKIKYTTFLFYLIFYNILTLMHVFGLWAAQSDYQTYRIYIYSCTGKFSSDLDSCLGGSGVVVGFLAIFECIFEALGYLAVLVIIVFSHFR